jgi:hypothetical protein
MQQDMRESWNKYKRKVLETLNQHKNKKKKKNQIKFKT